MLLAMLYKKYKNLKYVQGVLRSLHPAVVGMIASAGFSIITHALWNGGAITAISSIDFTAFVLIVVCILFLRKTKIDPTFIMLGAGAVGGLVYS